MKNYKGITDYSEFTEVSGKPITEDQLYRMRHRYSWARELINEDAIGLELCCGSGQGLKVVSEKLQKLYAIDITESLINQAKKNAPDNVICSKEDGITFLEKSGNETFDFILMFECIYYFESLEELIKLAKNCLKPGGLILFTWPNPFKEGFVRCEHTYSYPSIKDIRKFVKGKNENFETKFFGYEISNKKSLIGILKSKIKNFAVKFNLIPKTQKGRQFLKRIFQGKMIQMPNTVEYLPIDKNSLIEIKDDKELKIRDPLIIYGVIKRN
jgi:SAM-dependent methyltransferase